MAFSRSPDAPAIVPTAAIPGGTPTQKQSEPDLGHGLIPKERYTSKEFMELEWDRLWTKSWLMVCPESDVPEPGTCFTADIGRESVIVVRGESGDVRAFFNTCQHRGTRLREVGRGRVKKFVCPFHLWAWELDGKLLDVPDSDTFPQGIDCNALRLSSVRCDTWGGFVFINMNPEGESLQEYLGIIVPHLNPYHFERYALAEDFSVEWNCNWKTSVDAFSEAYHSMGLHRQLFPYLDDFRLQIDLYKRHSRFLVPQAVPSPRYHDQEKLNDDLKGWGRAIGMDVDNFQGAPLDFRKAFQKEKRRWLTENGFDFSELNDDQLTDDYHYTIFPNLSLNILAEEFWVFRQLPHPTDPDWMVFDFQIYRALPEGAKRPPRPACHRGVGADFDLNNEVLAQDAANLPNVQRGMHSRGYSGLYLSSQERRIRHFHKTLMEIIEGEQA